MSPVIVFIVVALCCWSKCTYALTSPCPAVLKYEEGGKTDRWQAVLTLRSGTEIRGLRLQIRLDNNAQLLGNWFNHATSEDNKLFEIEDKKYILKKNAPLQIRFFVKYLPTDVIPIVQQIKLNGNTICGLSDATSTSSKKENGTSTAIIDSRKSSNLVNIEDIICGTVVLQPTAFITHASRTSAGEFPWHGALYYVQKTNPEYKCGATLIGPRFALTAAHCVTVPYSTTPRDADIISLYFGKHSLRKWNAPGTQEVSVDEIIVHPAYSTTPYRNDLALLKLQTAVRVTDFVRPICLWSGDANKASIVGSTGIVTGWGFTESLVLSDELQQANMPIVDDLTCIRSLPEFFARYTSDTSFCAGYTNGTAVCNGDSGSGLVLPIPNTNPTRYRIRGIVSIGVAIQNVCDPRYYSVFTDVAAFTDYISNITQIRP